MYDNERAARVGVERSGRKKKQPLDRLTRDALAAEAAGMSYGKWKALHPHTPDEDDKEDLEVEPDCVIATCEGCGDQFIKFKWQKVKRFCCSACQNKYNRQKREREKKRANPGKTAVCRVCGKVFIADYQHRIYCGKECYRKSQLERDAERRRKKKLEEMKND